MSIRHLAQPYIVYTPWDESLEVELTTWLEDNILSYYLVTFVSSGAWILPARSDRNAESETLKKMMLFQFECPRDALLFKLTWGGT